MTPDAPRTSKPAMHSIYEALGTGESECQPNTQLIKLDIYDNDMYLTLVIIIYNKYAIDWANKKPP